MYKIESLLSARLFLNPQIFRDRIYFLSNISGHISLFVMNIDGSVPENLLPPDIALQNPHLLADAYPYYIFPSLQQIMVMIDKDGNEVYQPSIIPIVGGYPEQFQDDKLKESRCHLYICDPDNNYAYIRSEPLTRNVSEAYQINLTSGDITKIGESAWGCFPIAVNANNDKVVLKDRYTTNDNVLYLWENNKKDLKILFGTPLHERDTLHNYRGFSIASPYFIDNHNSLIMVSSYFSDLNGIIFFETDHPKNVVPLQVYGVAHNGSGELIRIIRLKENSFLLEYNVDGCSWLYKAKLDLNTMQMNVENTICGKGDFSEGTLESISFNPYLNTIAFSFSTIKYPTQLFSIHIKRPNRSVKYTNERLLGLSEEVLADVEDVSFKSFDGIVIPAKMYLPSKIHQFNYPLPLVYYIHGGPQSQERPDFAWFSTPLIQFLTLNGFAVFVPNVRGSTGYGHNFASMVDKDWGGKDRMDHVYAMEEILIKDLRFDLNRAGVVGRSYGGYMSLMLAGRHPELWSAAVDMFGPYDLLTFLKRIPNTWKPYYQFVLGNPDDKDDIMFLNERSPRIYLDNLNCPLLVIQGKNDPRVVMQESIDLVEQLRKKDKQVELLLFEDEGHDVLKYQNRVKCYNVITNFFSDHLKLN